MSMYFLDREKPERLKKIYMCSEDVDLNVRKIQLQQLDEEHHEYFKSEAKAHFGLPLRREIIGPEVWEIPDVGQIGRKGLQRYPNLRRILVEANDSPDLILVNAISSVY